ncbi:type IV toxin-antitoxin system AbiEi family antitoxin domain-containing protein [Actinomycetospora sp. NBRC 106378]|uniref:type IV toxin-antitoxin system AbiEi family antitoxin domain-containing protein n=1 Tax=Actinomycetospora sp. NBRC 106378 TaxID=3032208 RepID=UPI002553735E|nr:type IV toxin-antitoxin system AbiEi family antitoxin domain-containing protein [Actinomycetospora sp. NBRC 106378]
MSLDEKRLHRTVRDQDGAITLGQALECGYSHTTVRRKVAAGEWTRLAHRVYLLGSHRRTPAVLVRAALLSLGGDAVLVGPAAAWWHGLIDRCPDVIDVAVAPRHQHRARPGVRIVRRVVPRAASDTKRGVRVTTVPHTVLDTAAALGRVEGARVMDTALQRRMVALPILERLHEARPRRRGRPVVTRLLALAAGGAVSEAERRAHRTMTAEGIRGWTANLELDLPGFGRAVADVAFRREKVIVEIDGWAYHRDLRAFLHDARRQNALAAAGWTVIRTNWYELTGSPEVFIDGLRQVLAARS